jgi:hypothetical protein
MSTGVREPPAQSTRGVDGEGRVEDVEAEEEHEVEGEEPGDAGQTQQHCRPGTLARGPDAASGLLAQHPVEPCRPAFRRQRAGPGLGEVEGHERRPHRRDEKRREDGRHVVPPRGPQASCEGRPQDEAEVRRDRQAPEVGGAVFLRRDVGHIGLGHRDVPPGDAVESTGEEENDERQSEHRRRDVKHGEVGQEERDQEDPPRQQCPRLAGEKHPATAPKVRPTAEDGLTQQLERRICRGQQPVHDGVAAEAVDQEDQERQHDAVA